MGLLVSHFLIYKVNINWQVNINWLKLIALIFFKSQILKLCDLGFSIEKYMALQTINTVKLRNKAFN